MATPVHNAVAQLPGTSFENKAINGLVQGSVWQFSGVHQLTYSLDSSGYGGPWTAEWSDAVAQAMAAWTAVADLSITQIPSRGSVYQSNADLSISLTGSYLASNFGAMAMGIFPDPPTGDEVLGYLERTRETYPRPEGDAYFDDSYYVFQDLDPGWEGFETILHELGHVLGLKHPFDDGGNYRPTYAQLGLNDYDVGRWTVMSYNTTGQEATPMPLDILAIQRIYGANLGYHTGDDTYALTANAPLRTIWDAGGIDTLDLSGLSQGRSVRLEGGSGGVFADDGLDPWDACYLAIAYNVTLENVVGTPYRDFIHGNDANNVLDSGGHSWWEGAEELAGGKGDDTYVLRSNTDIVIEQPGEGSDTIRAGFDYTLPATLENLELAGDLDLEGTGNDLDNRITGNAGNNLLDGGAGADTLAGGAGDDTYLLDDPGDVVQENPGEGTDGVRAPFSHVLADNVENLELTGAQDADGTGNALNNVLIGNAGVNVLTGLGGDDLLDGGAGADSLIGGTGDDTYTLDDPGDTLTELPGEGADTVRAGFSFVLPAVLENLTLLGAGDFSGEGNAADNTLIGNAGANALTGHAGNDRLDGGGGNDTLTGGVGDDVYEVDSLGDVMVENPGEGTDTVEASVSLTLDADLEHLTLTGWGWINATGNGLDNILTGNLGNNTLDGGAGADILRGGAGDDTYLIDPGDLVEESPLGGTDTVKADFSHVLGDNLEKLTLLGAGNVDGTGNDLANTLVGNVGDNVLAGLAGNDQLDGGGGADSLIGGPGDDTYTVDATDTIVELPGEGLDGVRAEFDYVLADDLEKLTLLGVGDWTGTGNAADNWLFGNAGANALSGLDGDDLLDGGAGADTLIGGTGNDRYVVDGAGDSVSENPGEGIDRVESSVTWALDEDFENLYLTGYANIDGTGNDLDNEIFGNPVANHLDGGAGDDILHGTGGDVMTGGLGNDFFWLWSTGNQVVEQPGEGIDTVRGTVYGTTFLDANVENLELEGGDGYNGVGNAGDNQITGSAGNNQLDGGLGNDTLLGQGGNDILIGNIGQDWMAGGPGDDVYEVDDLGDSVVENAGEGLDKVQAWLDWTLDANVENLALLGNAHLNGTGNDLDNRLDGNAGDNILTGGAGNDRLNGWGNGGGGVDTLIGGPGDDVHIVNDGQETLVEAANEGIDTVRSSLTWTLAANFENLELGGFTNLDGTGNDLDNHLVGNGYVNVLTGLLGNDTLESGGGADTLVGGPGDDTYVISSGETIIELAGEGNDTVRVIVGYAYGYTLGANLENLELDWHLGMSMFGNTADNRITGDTGNDALYGLAGNDTLDGGAGADTLAGGAGHDAYVVDNAADSITENPNEGADTAKAWLSWMLGINLENLVLLGDADLNGTGNAVNNSITGNAGNNVLNGGAGSDALAGNGGDDTYLVDNVGDTVSENADAGYDGVISSVTFTLAANLEALTLTGAAHLNGTGNALDNALTGNAGNNTLQGGAGMDTLIGGAGKDTLDGGPGADTLAGGLGDDAYNVDDPGDVITESAGEGFDTVYTSLGIPVPDHVESLILIGNGDIDLTGQQGDNILTGNAGANVLDGGRGWDKLVGGTGDDTYLVDQMGDVLTEAANAGIDEVQALVSYALGLNLENLTLVDGAGNLDGTGNALANALTGNGGMNTLDGGGGNDFLWGLNGDDVLKGGTGNDEIYGGLGTDLLMGGAGNDRFVFDTDPGIGGNADWITDFVKGQDKLVLDDDVFVGIGAPGALGLAYFRVGANVTAQDSDDYVLYDTASGNLYYDPDGSGFEGSLLVATLTGAPVLAVADIVVVD